MFEDTPSACAKVAACICGNDGVISSVEERKIFEILAKRFPSYDAATYDEAITEFFDSDDQLEDYLALVGDDDLRKFTLELAEASAGADGLDPRENMALDKAYLIWGVKRNA
jgi:hypothetical protein